MPDIRLGQRWRCLAVPAVVMEVIATPEQLRADYREPMLVVRETCPWDVPWESLMPAQRLRELYTLEVE